MVLQEWKLEDAQQVWLEEGIEIGIEKGIEKERLKTAERVEEEKIEVARNALQMGISIADISHHTGLAEDEIRKLAH